MPWQRDPVSTWFDGAAYRYVTRAYANKGNWTGIYLAPPTIAQRQRLASMGLNPLERDRWGEVRWVRAFKRSCYHLVNYYGGVAEIRPLPNTGAGSHGWHAPVRVQWETGARVLKPGWPARRWAIRIAIHEGGDAASAHAPAATSRTRWVVRGVPTGRQSLPADPHGWERT